MKLIAYNGCREQCRSHSEGVIFLITFDFWKHVNILPCQKNKNNWIFFPGAVSSAAFPCWHPCPFLPVTQPHLLLKNILSLPSVHSLWLWPTPPLAPRQMIQCNEIPSSPQDRHWFRQWCWPKPGQWGLNLELFLDQLERRGSFPVAAGSCLCHDLGKTCPSYIPGIKLCPKSTS